jgi:hypothetical protein
MIKKIGAYLGFSKSEGLGETIRAVKERAKMGTGSAVISGKVGICPNCYDIVQIPKKGLFFGCPHCEATVATRQALGYLTEMCQNPSDITSVIDIALKLEADDDVESALEIMAVLRNTHRHNEHVAFTFVRLSGYDMNIVRSYLEDFAEVKGEKPYAEEFLENIIDFKNYASYC